MKKRSVSEIIIIIIEEAQKVNIPFEQENLQIFHDEIGSRYKLLFIIIIRFD